MALKLSMMKRLVKHFCYLAFFALLACESNEEKPVVKRNDAEKNTPKVEGNLITFPEVGKHTSIFKTVIANDTTTEIELKAPATVIARCKAPGQIIFQNPELTSIYSTYIQNLSVLSLTQTNYDRIKDLYDNGAATGKEFNEATGQLFLVKNTILENEVKLEEAGLHPSELKNAVTGTVWLISDLPETELNMIQKGKKCDMDFPSYPSSSFSATIQDIAQVLNIETRKVRVRLVMQDKGNNFRPGMYAKASFHVTHAGMMMPRAAILSVNANYYVFIKKAPNVFECREVIISTETAGRIEIADGIKDDEEVVISHTYLLKGIIFGI